nr:MAG TPA: hypothetical protein [Caudoviricetes sp.]
MAANFMERYLSTWIFIGGFFLRLCWQCAGINALFLSVYCDCLIL